MRYNFKRLKGSEWVNTINSLRKRRLTFLEVKSGDLYEKEKVDNIFNVYYFKTNSNCKIVYYEFEKGKWRKRLREISLSDRDIDPVRAVLTFKGIAAKFNENIGYEPHTPYSNGIYTYFKGKYEGRVTVLDMNSAYLHALRQPMPDYTTKKEITRQEVTNKSYDFYVFENELHREMFYKEDQKRMQGAFLWESVKIYGMKTKLYYQETAQELYRLREKDKDRYKNVANIFIGCMHKRSGKQNNTTIAAGLYAWFAWYIDHLVEQFKSKGYNVIMVTTDSIKIAGDYNIEDNIVKLGHGLGDFKVEYVGDAKYYSVGHYEEDTVKWKGKPQYMRDGFERLSFIENVKEELHVYERYAIV